MDVRLALKIRGACYVSLGATESTLKANFDTQKLSGISANRRIYIMLLSEFRLKNITLAILFYIYHVLVNKADYITQL